ncbi:MAG: hypothetical protein KatS3mg107_0848 [Gemmataceae bacterium]|nr:MAG: hypothetical protein KatS3mg107_0848 [Gemmataceae bacterium]
MPHGYVLDLFSELWTREPLPENPRLPWMGGLGNGTFELRLEEGSERLAEGKDQLHWILA